jgi:hypothetical protein
MASIAAGSTELSPGQRRHSAVYAVRIAAHGTAARVLGSVMPSTWIALAFVYTLRRQAEESLPAIGRRIFAAQRETVLSLRASPPKPLTAFDVGVTDELTLIYRDSRGRISTEHPVVASGLIQRGAALAADGSCVVPMLPPQLPPPNSSFELCPDSSSAICYLNRDLGTAQWNPPADSTPLQPYTFVDAPAFPPQPPPYPIDLGFNALRGTGWESLFEDTSNRVLLYHVPRAHWCYPRGTLDRSSDTRWLHLLRQPLVQGDSLVSTPQLDVRLGVPS